MAASPRRSRCRSFPAALSLGAALDEVEERLRQVSIAAALMAEEASFHKKQNSEMIAAERLQRDPGQPQLGNGCGSIREFRLRAPNWRSMRLCSRSSFMTRVSAILIILLLPIILMFVVIKLVPFWFSVGNRTLGSTSTSSSPPVTRNLAPAP